MPDITAGRCWELIRTARQELADDLGGLTEAQWRTRSLCSEWDVEQTLAHLIAAARTGGWRWVRSIVGAGFRPAVHNERRLREQLGESPEETLDRFRAVIGLQIAPTRDLAAYLGEVLVHGEDIRAPLGIDRKPSPEAVAAVLDFFLARNFTVASRSVGRGLTLTATDAPFTGGEGPAVSGPGLALMMTLAGRPQYLDQLAGPGVAALAERVGPEPADSAPPRW